MLSSDKKIKPLALYQGLRQGKVYIMTPAVFLNALTWEEQVMNRTNDTKPNFFFDVIRLMVRRFLALPRKHDVFHSNVLLQENCFYHSVHG